MSSERLDATNSAAAAMAVCSSAGRWEEVGAVRVDRIEESESVTVIWGTRKHTFMAF